MDGVCLILHIHMLIHKMSLCDVYVNDNDDDDESQTDKKNVEEEKKNLCKLWNVVCGATYLSQLIQMATSSLCMHNPLGKR